jgi:transcriptional regulator with XRE-family HTH domain
MNIRDEIPKMEAALRERGLSVDEFCDKADLARSTWTRWKSGAVQPNMATWSRVEQQHREIVNTTAPVASI